MVTGMPDSVTSQLAWTMWVFGCKEARTFCPCRENSSATFCPALGGPNLPVEPLSSRSFADPLARACGDLGLTYPQAHSRHEAN